MGHQPTFRYYGPRLGRFMSPDPLAGSVGDPQSLNRYAYVLNDPVNMVDPLGLNPEDREQRFWDRIGRLEARGVSDLGCTVNGLPFSCRAVRSFLEQGVLAFCPQCRPGQVVGNDNNIYGWVPWDPNDPALQDTTSGRHRIVPVAYWGVVGTVSSSSGLDRSWFQRGLDYIKSHPVFISVNEIVAVQIIYQRSTNTICSNFGLGASVPPTKAVTVGILNEGNMGRWTDVQSGWGYSFGANLFLGYQGEFNSSGAVGGPTISGIGLSGSYTFGACGSIP